MSCKYTDRTSSYYYRVGAYLRGETCTTYMYIVPVCPTHWPSPGQASGSLDQAVNLVMGVPTSSSKYFCLVFSMRTPLEFYLMRAGGVLPTEW